MQDCRRGLTRAEQRGRIPSLALLATLLGMQPGIWFAFWAESIYCWLLSGFIPQYPQVLLAELLPIPSLAGQY